MNKRRKFLGYLTSTIILPLFPARAAPLPARSSLHADDIVELLLDIVPDNRAARRLGRTIADTYPRNEFPSIALERLFGGIRNDGPLSRERLRRHLDNLRRADFEAGELVTVAGWILPRCEADAIAIASIYRGG